MATKVGEFGKQNITIFLNLILENKITNNFIVQFFFFVLNTNTLLL